MANPNIKSTLRLPRPEDRDLNDPQRLRVYLDNLVRAIEQNFINLYSNNNNPWLITPSTTASRTSLSIAGNTVNLSKVRDNLTSLIYVLKTNGRLN